MLPLIIGGFYRSGTSLVRRLIDSHSQFHCGPEVKFFKDFFGDYINDPLAHVRFFSSTKSYKLPDEDLLHIFGSAFVRFHETAAERAGKRRWADKAPENVLYLPAWQTLLGDKFLFVHVVRDPFDTLTSLKEIGFHLTVPYTLEERTSLYRYFLQCAESFCEQHPHRSFTLSYERLVTEPKLALQELFSFAGEHFEAGVLTDFNATERLLGLEDPKVSRTTEVHYRSVGRGSQELDGTEIAIISDILGKDL